MELKEFIVNALSDITEAIKECQQNVGNGAIFAPTNTKADNRINTPNGELTVSEVAFDVAVTASSENTDGVSGGGGISVLSLNFGLKGSNEDKTMESTISRIRFAIPLVYPPTDVQKKPNVKGLGNL